MTTIIQKNLSKAAIQELFRKLLPRKKFDANKYCGVLTLQTDPLAFQKTLRDEWE